MSTFAEQVAAREAKAAARRKHSENNPGQGVAAALGHVRNFMLAKKRRGLSSPPKPVQQKNMRETPTYSWADSNLVYNLTGFGGQVENFGFSDSLVNQIINGDQFDQVRLGGLFGQSSSGGIGWDVDLDNRNIPGVSFG